MKVFLDANILISVLNKEYPLFSYSSRLLSLADSKIFKLFTSPVCLAIAFYFAKKKSGRKMARQKIRMLISKIHITEADRKAVVLAAEHKAVEDFEDGLEYYAALNAGCQCIVTENTGDFYFSEIEVLQPHQFLEQHVIKHL